MIGRLPKSLEVGGIDRSVRTDFRDALVIMAACNDPELNDREKTEVMLAVLYEDFEQIPREHYQEAAEKAAWFLDCGQTETDKKPVKKLIDWEQDESMIFPAVNKIAGMETRCADYIHWWTFMGYFMEIEEGTFSMILGIRQKRSKGKKLEKWEQEFFRDHKSMCEIKTRYTQAEQEEIDYYNKLLG